MRLFLAALLSSCLLVVPSDAGEKIFPYKAHITADEVYVRSGPGQSYYPTDKLKAGQQVEVYRHDPGGWYAIKPPQGSFTWVSGRFLQPGEDNLAVVADQRVAARVGSRFSDIRDVIQVRLHKAEVVEVLEARKSGSGAGRTTWYKIAPPAGEFRWVFGRYVTTEHEADGLRKTQPPTEQVAATGVAPPRDVRPTGAAAEQWGTDEPADADPRQPDDRYVLSYAPVGLRDLSPQQYKEKLEEIDAQLSSMVVEEPTVWEFDALRERGLDLFDQAQTALERGRVRVLLGKIDRFDDIKQRYHRVASMRERTEQVQRRLARLKPRQEEPDRTDDTHETDDGHDGVGELTRVVSAKEGAPRYALVDREGSVRCYVTPVPGVNLYHYVGRRVAVSGARGYIPELRARHVMAKQVSELDKTRLR